MKEKRRNIREGYKDSENTSFILNIKEDPEGGNSEWFMHEFQDKGSIIFTSLDEYNKIVNFVYADNKEGYFDLEKNEVIFESDNVKKN